MAVAQAGRLHYVGGKTRGQDTGEHDVYDPATNRWTTAAPMPTARDHAAGAVVHGLLYVAAGRPGELRTLEVYDPATDRWAAATALPAGRSSVAAAAFGGLFLVLGGEDAGERHVVRDVDAYDPARRRWTTLTPLPAGRQGIGAAVVGSRLYLPGGGPTAGGSAQSDTLLVLG